MASTQNGRVCSSMKTIIVISVISMLALGMSILPMSVYAKAAHMKEDTKTHYVTRYHVMDMDTNQVVQVVIVVNTARIIEMGILQDGMLQRMLIIMDNNL